MIIYAFDPGRNTGWARWDLLPGLSEFQMPTSFGEMKQLELFQFLDNLFQDSIEDLDWLFIYENYRINNRNFNHQWNDGETLRVIGAIEYRAHQLGIKFISQEPSVRPMGAGYSGLPHDPRKHTKDHISAMQHGYYYMIKNKLMLPRS